MLDDGTRRDDASPLRAPFEGTATEARARPRELRVRFNAQRPRLARRRTGLDRREWSDPEPDAVAQVQRELQQAREQIHHLETALASNRRIGMAIGIVMARQHLTDERAFELLRQQSQLRNQKLRDLAEEVIYTGVL